jgi:hypothetical protein
MYIKTSIFTIKRWLMMPIVLFGLFSSISAQTGAKTNPAESSATQTVESKESTAKNAETKTTFAVDATAPKYKLVFTKQFDGKLFYTKTTQAELDHNRNSAYDNFTEQLNMTGAQGYRLHSLLSGSTAVVKLDEIQYQYNWFDTTSTYFFSKGKIQRKLEDNSSQEFRIAHDVFLGGSCNPIYMDNERTMNIGENCKYFDHFITEKELEKSKPYEQTLVNTIPHWGGKTDLELEAQLKEKLAQGFYPVNVLSKYEILCEKINNPPDEKPEVRVIIGDIEKKSNELANQGFRLSLVNNGIAVMYRTAETSQNVVSYIWLKTDTKNIEAELAKIGAKGGTYKTIYPDAQGNKKTFIFEQKLNDEKKPTEFKLLTFEIDSRMKSIFANQISRDLSLNSKETEKTMNKLVKEGFEVRDLFGGVNGNAKTRLDKSVKDGVEKKDLFDTSDINVILERIN